MWVSWCLWMDGHGGDLISSIFEEVPECPEDLSLSILTGRPHKELCLRKPARPEEKDEGQSVRARTPSWESVGSETPKRRVRHLELGRKTQSNEDDGQMSQHVLVAVWDFCRVITIVI